MSKHTDRSKFAMEKIVAWGFPLEVQQRLGALSILWGVFETNLETTLWAMTDEDVAGVRPTTDKKSIGQWIDDLSVFSRKFGVDSQAVLRSAAIAAKDLMDYRHSIVHGWLIPSENMPTLVRNPSWHGEIRKRPSGEAYIDENLLDMAIDTAWVLCRVVFATRVACDDEKSISKIIELGPDVSRARSQANELRHLRALMNHEKY